MDLNKEKYEPSLRISRVRIFPEGNFAYQFVIQHNGHFKLQDYEEFDLEIKSARLIRKR